jgi:hypothetical protein
MTNLVDFEFSKGHETFNFEYHGKYNVDELKKYVSSFIDQWEIDTDRQKEHVLHSSTQTYVMQDFSLDWKVGDGYNPTRKCEDEKLWSLVNPIISDAEQIHNGKSARILLVKLMPGENIIPHKDYGHYLGLFRRHHLPVITEPRVLFTIQDENLSMEQGDLWEINNNKFHSVHHMGKEIRVHLLFDIAPNKFLRKI